MEQFHKLSRAEMKNVLGGVDAPGCSCKNVCNSDDDCPGRSECTQKVDCMGSSPSCKYKDCGGAI